MQQITVNLWFNSEAEKAVDFYTSIFPGSVKGRTTYYGKAGFEFHNTMKKPDLDGLKKAYESK